MADILVAYTQRQLCTVESDRLNHHLYTELKLDAKLPTIEELDEIPRV